MRGSLEIMNCLCYNIKKNLALVVDGISDKDPIMPVFYVFFQEARFKKRKFRSELLA